MQKLPEHAFLRSHAFDALLVILIFFGFALAYDYSLDETLTVQSIMTALGFSLIVGLLVGFRARFEQTESTTIKRRSETFEVVGKIIIGLLLFGVLAVLLLTQNSST